MGTSLSGCSFFYNWELKGKLKEMEVKMGVKMELNGENTPC